MKDREKTYPHLRERMLFVAEVGDSKKSIFIKFLEAGKIVEFIDTIEKDGFLAEITPLALNHLSQSDANLNISLAMILCRENCGRVLRNYALARKIDKKALNAALPESAGHDAGKSCVYYLCLYEEKNALLYNYPALVAKIQ